MNEPRQGSSRAEERLPIVEEQFRISKEAVETGSVRIATRVQQDVVKVEDRLIEIGYRVERVPVDQIVDAVPPVRTEAGRMIVSVTEEVLVKRIRVIEELHLIEERSTRQASEQVTLRRTEVTVTRED